jgi:hypothetical protein
VPKRPCKQCGRWFEPHPRAGDRQTTCSSPECQRERNRKAVRAWRAKSDTPEKRLSKKIRAANAASPEDCVSPNSETWSDLRNAVDPKTLVVLQELLRLVGIVIRNAVRSNISQKPTEPGAVLPEELRNAVGRRRKPPLAPP